MTGRAVTDQSATMRSWQVTTLGEPEEAVREMRVPLPTPESGDAVIDVHAVALGFPDMLLARGLYHDKPDLPITLGGEAAGVVRSVPADSEFVVGDRVIVVPGQVARGMLSDRLAVPADRLLPVPDGMPIGQAAAFFSATHTSYMGLVRRCSLQAGETLLVQGASGGIGSAAIGIGRALGARVIAVTRGAHKVDHCRALGADDVIDSAAEDVIVRVADLTAGHGADVVFDPVGGTTTDVSRRCIALEGRLLIVGFASGEIPVVPVNHALLKNYSIVGYRTWPFRGDPRYRREVHDRLCRMYADGFLTPQVEELAADQVATGLRRLADREVAGRLVVRLRKEDS